MIIIPLGNLVLGLYSILFVLKGEIEYAVLLLLVGLLLDSLDSYTARKLDRKSDLKKELDSLADIISFGVAPAMIMYVAVFHELHTIGVLIASIFPICGALRLAYFHTQSSSKKYVIGLPIGLANGILATFILFGPVFNKGVSMMVILVLSYFMISKIKFFRVNGR